MKSAAGTLAATIGWNGQSKDDCVTDMDVDSIGPIIEIGEEISEVLFQSLLDFCPEDEVVVRSVRKCLVFRSSLKFDNLGFTS